MLLGYDKLSSSSSSSGQQILTPIPQWTPQTLSRIHTAKFKLDWKISAEMIKMTITVVVAADPKL